MDILIMLTTSFMVNIMGHTRTKETNNRDMEFNVVDVHYVQSAIYRINVWHTHRHNFHNPNKIFKSFMENWEV